MLINVLKEATHIAWMFYSLMAALLLRSFSSWTAATYGLWSFLQMKARPLGTIVNQRKTMMW